MKIKMSTSSISCLNPLGIWRVLGVAAILLATSTQSKSQVIGNAGFEDYLVPSGAPGGVNYSSPFGTLQNGSPGLVWDFLPSSGESYNGLFKAGDFQPQTGNQGAFVEGTGRISQAVNFSDGGQFVLTLGALGRVGFGPNPIVVTFGGVTLTFNGASVLNASTSEWTYYTSDPFNLVAGNHVLSITGQVPITTSDLMTFVDNISVTSVPEPGSLVAIGLLFILALFTPKMNLKQLFGRLVMVRR